MKPSEFAPLAGIEVLELSRRSAGGYCGYLLAQLGAQVTRVDLPWVASVPEDVRDVYRRALDRGKAILPTSALKDVRRAAGTSHVLIVDCLDMPQDDDETTALVQDLLDRRSPSAGLTHISTFGGERAKSGWTGDSLVTSAWTAASWSIGSRDREPLTVPADLPEYFAGTHAAGACIAGLLSTEERGPGSVNRVTLTDTFGYVVAMIVTNFVPYERAWHRDGPRATESGGCYPGAIFECLDGPISVMCRQQREWDALRLAMGMPAWSRLERFQDPRIVARRHADEADTHLKPWILTRTRSELVALGREFGFPVAPIRSVADNLHDEQFVHRSLFEDLDGSDALSVRVPGRPFSVLDGPAASFGASAAPSSPPRNRRGTSSRPGPLSGVRVLDLTWVWSGPMVTSALADLGAEVIKIEHASHPDPARARGRAVRDGREVAGPALELSPYFNQLGHDKQSVSIDLASPEGQELLLNLASTCDVVIENMRPGVLSRHGLGYEALREANPGIVLLSMSVMGQTGPASTMMGYGVVMSGLAGLESLAGYPDEITGLFNLALSDPNAGNHALVVLLAALHRQRTIGRGCWIDVSQTECTVCVLLGPLLEAQLQGNVRRMGNQHPSASPHGHFRAAGEDAWVAVSAQTDGQRATLADFLGAPGPGSDLETLLATRAAQEDASVLAGELQALGIAASPVYSWEQLRASGWFEERGYMMPLDHPYLGEQDIMALPWEVGDFRPRPERSSPLLGEHTIKVLRGQGVTDSQLDSLVASGAVVPSSWADTVEQHAHAQKANAQP